MKVETYLFGAVEVSPEKVISFPNGLVGFEQSKRYILAHQEGSDQSTPAVYLRLLSMSLIAYIW